GAQLLEAVAGPGAEKLGPVADRAVAVGVQREEAAVRTDEGDLIADAIGIEVEAIFRIGELGRRSAEVDHQRGLLADRVAAGDPDVLLGGVVVRHRDLIGEVDLPTVRRPNRALRRERRRLVLLVRRRCLVLESPALRGRGRLRRLAGSWSRGRRSVSR